MDEVNPLIGLVAGEGEFPIILAENLKKKHFQIIGICFSKSQREKLKNYSEEVHQIYIGQLEKLMKIFKERKVKNLVFLGKIDKSYALKIGIPDFKALSIWRKVKNKEDDTLLRALIEELEREGFSVRAPSEFLQEFLTPEGILTKREPNREEWEDIKYGFKMAKALGKLDIGQCVVVKDRMTVAVEAMEGTDATILRAGSLRKHTVVVKVVKPLQDMRLDLPVVGEKTVETIIKAKAKILALEAHKTFFLQKEKALKLANQYGISIVGYKDEEN